ncbi:Modification methylase MboII [uncultured Clostridium sp.]|nr:Modification methylase MboII [uncultured Clostridium sp.]SCI99622.1 Modification methylase MboII [uncultured Clostridium sp.]
MEDLIDKIINMDCLDGMKYVKDNYIDLVVTSPPYNLGIDYDSWNDSLIKEKYIEFMTRIAKELYRVIKPDGRVCLNIPCDGTMLNENKEDEKCDITYMIKEIFYSIGFKYRNKIYWDKRHLSNNNARGSYESASSPNILLPFEEIIIFYKEDKKKVKDGDINEIIDSEFREYTYGHWVIDGQKHKNRNPCPVPFPQEIPARLIRLFSYRGDIVLDPFSGDGTTCLVAKKLGRNYIGFEISEKYASYANERIKNIIRTK